MPYVGVANLSVTVLHPVLDYSGQTVSGEAANLTYVLRDESGNTQTTGVAIAEQGSTGYYECSFTPDATGVWLLSVTNPAGTDLGTYSYYTQCVANAAGVTPSGTWLTTRANVEEVLGYTLSNPDDVTDAYLDNLIARASQMCEDVIGRPVVQAAYTEYCDGNGTSFLNLRRGPIVSVSSVSSIAYDSAGSETATALAAGNYFSRGTESDWYLPGYLEMNSSAWTKGQRNYKIIYNAGWATVPYFVEAACIYAVLWMKNRRKDSATTGRDIGDGSMAFRDESDLHDDLNRKLYKLIDQRV